MDDTPTHGAAHPVMEESPAEIMEGRIHLTSSDQPKLKGRHRLLKSLQKVTSSQSLTRFHKTASQNYRPYGRGSVSCVSLSRPLSPLSAPGSSHGNKPRFLFATAPNSALGTPGFDTPFIDASSSAFLPDGGNSSYRTPLTPATDPTTLADEIGPSAQGDYFSRPLTTQARRPRTNFDFWGEMPWELKMEIFTYLTPKEVVRSARVSKAWHSICFDGQLWANLDTSEYYRKIPADVLSRIISNAGPFVRDLNLRGCIQLWANWGTSELPDACRNLENLSLQDCRLDRSTMHTLICQNNRLVHINLTRIACVHNSTMRIIAENCPRLELLNINWCSSVDTRGLREIVRACPNLRDLRAGEVRGFDDVDFMLELFSRNKLERLLLPNCESLTDEAFSAFIEGTEGEMDYITHRRIVPARKLKHLDISRCRNITDTAITSMIGNMPELEGLQLTRCKSLTDDSLKPLLASLPSLTHLDLEEVELLTNDTLHELAKAPCKNTLQHLCISYCELLGDVGMLLVIKNCTNLRNLDLDNTRVSDLCLAEAAAMVRNRSSRHMPPLHRAITWDGIGAPARQTSITTTSLAKPKVGLRMAVYDCQNITWTGIREVLCRNTETRRPPLPSILQDYFNSAPSSHPDLTVNPLPLYPTEIISLKVFYGYQPTVLEHERRVLRGDFSSATRLERKWAEYMVASEEAGAALGVGTGNGTGNANALIAGFGTVGNRRRRRRVREAQMMHADEEEGPGGVVGRRRRARSGGGCLMM